MNKHMRLAFAKAAIVLAFLIIAAESSAQIGPPPAPPPLVISEFRTHWYYDRDEYIEIYNNSNKAHTVEGAINSAGYAIVASDGYTRCVIPTGTVIPARGHFLCVNSAGYSLGSYPGGTGDATYTRDIPDDAGVALFRTSNKYDFNVANRIDAFGSNSVHSLYREGLGYPFSEMGVGTFYRDTCGKHGDTQNFGPCPYAGFPKDTNDNAVDCMFLGNTVTDGAGFRVVGASGPENLSSPIYRGAGSDLTRSLFDPLSGLSAGPNRVRDYTSDINVGYYGTLTFRRTFTNRTSRPITSMRFRLIDASTFMTPGTWADIRARSVPNTWLFFDENVRQVRGTTLEEPPDPNFTFGGGFNSSLSVNGVSYWTPIAPGASIDLQLMFGIFVQGHYRFAVVIETLPATTSSVWFLSGDTELQVDAEQ